MEIPLPPFFLRSNKMQAPPGYKEVDVPPHLMKLFNETFQHDFGHCRLLLRDSKGKYSDTAILKAILLPKRDNVTRLFKLINIFFILLNFFGRNICHNFHLLI